MRDDQPDTGPLATLMRELRAAILAIQVEIDQQQDSLEKQQAALDRMRQRLDQLQGR